MALQETYNKNYKFLLIIPAVLLFLSLFYLAVFYQQNSDFIHKDISLTGGTSLTIYPAQPIALSELKSYLSGKFADFSVREVTALTTGAQEAVIIESSADADELKRIIEDYLGYKLTLENSSTEFTGAFLSEQFYNQLIKAMIFAFILMAIVVFIIFRTAIPSLAVILSAFADIVMTLALIDILGIRLSTAGIVAFLMLIGYSVDTDIMLTAKSLKQQEGELNSRIFSSLKTGLTMTLTSLVAVIVALLITSTFSEILRQIFLILAIGLGFDLINTWVTNTSILKWYVESKHRKAERKEEAGEER